MGLNPDAVERHPVLQRLLQQVVERLAAVSQYPVVVHDEIGIRRRLARPAIGFVDGDRSAVRRLVHDLPRRNLSLVSL
jgi:hypothetical protein